MDSFLSNNSDEQNMSNIDNVEEDVSNDDIVDAHILIQKLEQHEEKDLPLITSESFTHPFF